jgi:hypothetical protein
VIALPESAAARSPARRLLAAGFGQARPAALRRFV